MAEKFLGAPYPIVKHPNGFFRTQSGTNQIKSDLLILLLTNPGERVMLPDYGVGLNEFIFEPNDFTLAQQVKERIINAINTWEPRVIIEELIVSIGGDIDNLNPIDPLEDVGSILSIKINFVDPDNLQEIQELRLEVPLAGA